MSDYKYAIEIEGVSKSFGGIYALKQVDLKVERGTCHALVGENGAGKSTLMKVISGIIKRDSGTIKINGKEEEVTGLRHAEELGIAFVPQELSFVSQFTVAENIFLGEEPVRKSMFIDWNCLFTKAENLLEELHINIPARTPARELSVSDQQMMVIARILSKNAEIIIMDEPTARLGHGEIDSLMEYIRLLKSQGKTIIYISHRLEEIFWVCDRVTVLRDGSTIDTVLVSSVDHDKLIHMMVNRNVNVTAQERQKNHIGEVVFSVKHLCKKGLLNDVSFYVRRGEILGLFGLVGSGRSEAIRAVLGVDQYEQAEISLEGKAVKFKNIGQALAMGIALVPEERRQQGILPTRSIQENITVGHLREFVRRGLIDKKKELSYAGNAAEELGVACQSITQHVGDLSGGNQQKVVIAKYIDRDIKVFILDEPTRGIDVGAKDQIYKIIDSLAEKGMAVIVISSEIPELQLMCDRVCVMAGGMMKAELSREEFLASDTVLKHAIGV